MSVRVYGYSDDLIEIEGDIEEEFYHPVGHALLAFSNGTLLDVEYSLGFWRIRALAGDADIHPAQGGSYSDEAAIDAHIRWVLKGEEWWRSDTIR